MVGVGVVVGVQGFCFLFRVQGLRFRVVACGFDVESGGWVGCRV